MDMCAPRRLLLFSLPTPKLSPEHPLFRQRRRGRTWPGIARCATEVGTGWGGIVEDDLSELLQVIVLPFFPDRTYVVCYAVCCASRWRSGSTEKLVQISRELSVLYEFLFVVNVTISASGATTTSIPRCKFSCLLEPCMHCPEYKYI